MSGTASRRLEIVSLQVGRPRTLGRDDAADPMDETWTTGIFKDPVEGAVRLGRTGLEGDGQADRQHHGGPDKAVNVYPLEHYPYWQRDLAIAALPRGAFGENFTTAGLLETDVRIGDIFEAGEALLQLSQPRQPCWKLSRRWRTEDLARRVEETGRTGWYFRVVREGRVWAGAELRLVRGGDPRWTVAAANDVMHRRKEDLAAALDLAECPGLSASWRENLLRRASGGDNRDTRGRLDGAG